MGGFMTKKEHMLYITDGRIPISGVTVRVPILIHARSMSFGGSEFRYPGSPPIDVNFLVPVVAVLLVAASGRKSSNESNIYQLSILSLTIPRFNLTTSDMEKKRRKHCS